MSTPTLSDLPGGLHLPKGCASSVRATLKWCSALAGCQAAWLICPEAEGWNQRDRFEDQDPLPESLEALLATWAQHHSQGPWIQALTPELDPVLADHCAQRQISHLHWVPLPAWAPYPATLLLGRVGPPDDDAASAPIPAARDLAFLLWLDQCQHGHRQALSQTHEALEQVGALNAELARLRQHAEREGELSRTRVAEAENTKNEFLASVSHELRTPLNAIQGYTRIVLREAQLTERQRLSLERVMTSSQNQLRLINNVLDYSRLEAGRMRLELEALDLVQVLRDVATQVEPLVQERGLHLAQEIFPAVETLPTVSDRAKLEQVLVNLVGNAIKFTSRGHITLRLRSEGGSVHLDVEDTGIGIPADEQARVFERFRRSRSADASRTVSGTGLGLAISQALAQLLGGQIRLQSNEGEGSCFTVSLPLFLDLETAALTLVGPDDSEDG